MQKKNLYKKLYLIRRAEQIIIENYKDDEMKTPMHMSAGEEAIIGGICEAAGKTGVYFSTYRSHAIYLVSSGETDLFFSELYGKVSGMAKGKGGSMHLSSVETGYYCSSAIVASVIPVAVGAAYANKLNETDKIVIVFFGDGAIDEGAFWESINLACVLRLPMLFVCEDNGLAVHTPTNLRHGYQSIIKIVSQFDCHVFESESTDAEEIYQMTNQAMGKLKVTSKPAFLHMKYYRYLEHVGVYEDFKAGYRSKDEFLKWQKRDPVQLMRKKLLDSGVPESEINYLENEINNQINKSLRFAQEDRFPEKDELYKDVYS